MPCRVVFACRARRLVRNTYLGCDFILVLSSSSASACREFPLDVCVVPRQMNESYTFLI